MILKRNIYNHSIFIFLCFVFKQSASFGIQVFKHEGLLHNFVAEDNGVIFVAGENVFIQFTNASLSSERIAHRLNTSSLCYNCTNYSETNNIPTVLWDIKIREKSYVLFCGSHKRVPCTLHNASDISNFWTVLWNEDPINIVNGRSSVVVSFKTTTNNLYFLTATPQAENQTSDEAVFTLNKLSNRTLDFNKSSITFQSSRNIFSKSNHNFNFTFGFETGQFVYVLRSTLNPDGRVAYISQMCQKDIYFRSYIEAKFQCHGYGDLVTAAIFNTSKGEILLASFIGSNLLGVLCLYKLRNINETFFKGHNDCFHGISGTRPEWMVSDGNPSCTKNIVSRIGFS